MIMKTKIPRWENKEINPMIFLNLKKKVKSINFISNGIAKQQNTISSGELRGG